jgi:vancomycin resistance protein YoaR
MTWDTREPRNQTKPSNSRPQGWDGPAWWDESGVPTRKTASSVRSATPAHSVRGTTTALPTSNESGNGNGSNGSGAAEKVGILAAKRAKPRAASKPRSPNSMVSARFVAGFAVGIFGALFLASFAVLGLSRAYDGKIMPNVRAGAVDVSGLTRDEAISAIDAQYASLGQGKVTITTPVGTDTITYQQAGRGPDSAAMADAALEVGHGDNPVTSVASAIRTFTGGVQIPVVVKLDPLALETRLHQMTGSSLVPATDANVSVTGADFKVMPGAAGRGIDETVIATGLIDELAKADAPKEFQVGGKFITVPPNVSDQDAQAAIDSAGEMSVDVTLSSGTKTFKIDAATIRGWLMFGVRTDGTFGPVVNPALVKTYVATLEKDVDVKAIEPNIIYTGGNPTGVTGGKAGLTLDVDGTSQAIEAYLDALGSGGPNTGATVAVVANEIQPTLGVNPSLTGFKIIGSWYVTYFPGEANGGGVNISLPASLLNGQVISPGEQFSFLRAVGPIDAAHGWKTGGVILNGQSQHSGAIGGGICSVSTTLFNAVVRAGLEINERHAHFYAIDRYPVGLDATVYSNGYTTWDMRWTNDTPNPIVIRSWTSGTRTTRKVNFQLWSLPTGRKVTFSPTPAPKTDIVVAKDTTVYVPALPAGAPAGAKSYRQEYPTNGFNTTQTRTVTDSTGAIIHHDTWVSHYAKVDGILEIKGKQPPPATPTPPPTHTPPPVITPPPTAKPTPTPRRRRFLRP